MAKELWHLPIGDVEVWGEQCETRLLDRSQCNKVAIAEIEDQKCCGDHIAGVVKSQSIRKPFTGRVLRVTMKDVETT